jgi:hypothetical protein
MVNAACRVENKSIAQTDVQRLLQKDTRRGIDWNTLLGEGGFLPHLGSMPTRFQTCFGPSYQRSQ